MPVRLRSEAKGIRPRARDETPFESHFPASGANATNPWRQGGVAAGVGRRVPGAAVWAAVEENVFRNSFDSV